MSSFDQIFQGRRKKAKEELFLLSYADLVTNLMAIFVMLLSISKIDVAKFDAVASKMTTTERKNTLTELQKQLNTEIRARNLQNRVHTVLDMTGLNVEFLSAGFFDSASADISPKAASETSTILQILSRVDQKYRLSFEGHTDDVPIKKSGIFRDNWDLSSARGVGLLSRMKEMGIPETRMSVGGYAHTRPKSPLTGKMGKELENARAENRRVVIRVYQ